MLLRKQTRESVAVSGSVVDAADPFAVASPLVDAFFGRLARPAGTVASLDPLGQSRWVNYRVGLVDAVLPYLMILDILAILIGSRRDVEPLREQVERTIERRKLKHRTGAARTSP